MKPLPALLLVADRGHFVAYRTRESGPPELLGKTDIPEGIQRLREQVTDKAGSFPAAESQGHGTSVAERTSLTAELEARCVRQVAQLIESHLEDWPDPWGFAAPPAINSAVLESLRPGLADRLAVNVRRNLTRIPASEITTHFVRARDEGQ